MLGESSGTRGASIGKYRSRYPRFTFTDVGFSDGTRSRRGGMSAGQQTRKKSSRSVRNTQPRIPLKATEPAELRNEVKCRNPWL